MFFALIAIKDHPCCKMQEVVEAFFLNSISEVTFSANLFPEWFRDTLEKPTCSLLAKFNRVHALLHAAEVTEDMRRAVYDLAVATNRIQSLCDGTEPLPSDNINWEAALGNAIVSLMSSLYDSLDFAVFRRDGSSGAPTHQLYVEFIDKNERVCPFCGLSQFKNPRGIRREDFDHYLHKSAYPFAASNMQNLVPTCGTCNQDYKKAKDILADGAAFYPYAALPEVKLEVECQAYPAPDDLDDTGEWSVKLELLEPGAAMDPRMIAWNRVYSIKKRLEDEIAVSCEEWMNEVTDGQTQPLGEDQFLEMIALARTRAIQSSHRRMQPGQIVRAAFFDFMHSRADTCFVESFRRSQNARCG